MQYTTACSEFCQSVVLDKCDCMQSLASQHVGHLGLTAKALPVVMPIRYSLVGQTIVFATDSQAVLTSARNNAVACVGISGVDRATGSDWSVLAIGRLRESADPARMWSDKQVPPAWGAPLARQFVALDIELLSGTTSAGICSH